jgi:ADP-ribose pyrophosphatase YjhB (NUDIX family)
VLVLKEGGNLRLFPAHQEPTEATMFGFSVLAFAAIFRSNNEEPLFVVIKRGAHLRTFPGKLAFPGGYMDSFGGQPYATAIRELREETGDWAPYWTYKDTVALLDSVPTPKHHNITAIVLLHTSMDLSKEDIILKMIPQKSEIADVYLMTFSEMQERVDEFTPGIQKMLNIIQIDSKGNISWK